MPFDLDKDGTMKGFLELQDCNGFSRVYCSLDVEKRCFFFTASTTSTTQLCNQNQNSIDVQEIVKIAPNPQKARKACSFEVSTTTNNFIFVASYEDEMIAWTQQLKKAATSPIQTQLHRVDADEKMPKTHEAQKTSIIGDFVVKTPVSTMEKRNNSNTFVGGLRILKEGFCWKQGAVMKNWKRRYFRLNAVKLSYYETKEEPSAIRSITTNDIKKVRVLERFCNRKNVLEVETPSRKFYMEPEYGKDVELWRIALEDIIQSSGMYLPKTKSV